MRPVEQILSELPVNNLDLYVELGHKAGEKGKLEEAMSWYEKGLKKARALHDHKKAKEFSGFIFTLL
ncbi:MAG: hypothetical protein Crog4KO_04380 [Crocinitomicaceae bacterium]